MMNDRAKLLAPTDFDGLMDAVAQFGGVTALLASARSDRWHHNRTISDADALDAIADVLDADVTEDSDYMVDWQSIVNAVVATGRLPR